RWWWGWPWCWPSTATRTPSTPRSTTSSRADMIEHAYLIPLLPFFASLVIIFGGKEDPHSKLPFVGIGAMGLCLIQSLAILGRALPGPVPLPYEANRAWFDLPAQVGGKSFLFPMPIGVLIDGPAAFMLVVVTLVSFLVQVYSLGYMHGDPRFKRYYAFLSF